MDTFLPAHQLRIHVNQVRYSEHAGSICCYEALELVTTMQLKPPFR